MPSIADISQDIGLVAASLDALASAAPRERAQLTAAWREYMREGRAGLQRQADLFERLYKDAVHNLGLREIKELAGEVLKQRQEENMRIQPVIEVLRRNLAAHSDDRDLSFIFNEALEIACGTIENFDSLRERLLALASGRIAPDKILRARPVEGEIDHAALSREFIARFPNLRARLAE